MKYSIIPKTKLSGIVTTTLLFVILVLFLYFFVTIQRNEKRINQRAFRILNQYSLNINQRIQNHSKIALNDSLSKVNGIAILDDLLNKTVEKPNQDTVIFIAKNGNGELLSKVSSHILFENIFKDDLFDDYIVIEKNSIKYQTLVHNLELSDFKTFLNLQFSGGQKQTGLFNNQSDTLVNSGRYFKSGFITQIKISDTDYLLFLNPVIPGINENDWYLGGLINAHDFIKAKRKIETWIIIMLSLIVLFIIISLPIVKLFLINKTERIHQRNIYFVGASLVFGAAVMLLLLLNIITAKFLATESFNSIHHLNNEIKENFTHEIKQVYDALTYYNNKDKITSENNCLRTLPDDIYPYFKTVFWMDSVGNQLAEIKTWNKDINLVNLKYRDYFKYYNSWQLPFDDNALFRLSSIYSNTSGDALVAIATGANNKEIDFIPTPKISPKIIDYKQKIELLKRDTIKVTFNKKTRKIAGKEIIEVEEIYELGELKEQINIERNIKQKNKAPASTTNQAVIKKRAKVKALTSQFYSVIETVLPDGYEYRIIDKNGNVWFHNEKDNNLQENILTESNYNRTLNAAIENRKNQYLKLSLYSKDYYAYITPIAKLPLFLVTLQCKNSNIHQNAQITLTIILYLVFILILGIIFITVIIKKETGKTQLSFKPFPFDWLLPKPDKTFFYKKIYYFNIIQGLILLTLIVIPSLKLFSNSLNVLLFCLSVFYLNVLYLYTVLKLNNKTADYFIIIFTSILVAFSLVRIWFDPLYILYFVLLLIVGGIAFYITNKESKPGTTKNYLWYYKRAILIWLIVISIITPTYFYKSIFIDSTHIETKQQQLHIAKKIEKRNLTIDGHYYKNIYSKDFSDDAISKIAKVKERKKQLGIYNTIYFNTRHYYNYKPADGNHKNHVSHSYWLTRFYNTINKYIDHKDDTDEDLYYHHSANSYWNWETTDYDLDKTYQLCYNVKTKDENFKVDYQNLLIKSDAKTITPIDITNLKTKRIVNNIRHFYWVILFFIGLGFLMWVIYEIISLLLSRIFFTKNTFGIVKYKFTEAIDYLYKQNLDGVLVNLLDQDEIKLLVKKDDSLLNIDDINIDDLIQINLTNKKLIKVGLPTIEEDLINDLSLLKKVAEKCEKNIIVVSPQTPTQLVKYYKTHIFEKKNEEQIILHDQLAEKIKNTFSNYVTLFIDEESEEQPSDNLIESELSVTNYLRRLKPILDRYLNENPESNSDELILKIKNIANSHYQSIWDSCTLEERFILFDLAHDSITNTKNSEELTALIGKRIIKLDNGLEIMNKSFANFILDHTNKNKLKYFELEAKRKGGWNNFKLPLIIIVSGIVIFVITTQQSLISNLNAMLISIGGVIGIFAKYAGLFKGNSE